MQLSDGKIQRIEFVGKVDRVLNQNKQQDQNQNQNKQQNQNQNQTNQEQQNQQDRTPRTQQDQNQVQIKGKLKSSFFLLYLFFLIVFL